jgi:hypothetical protein
MKDTAPKPALRLSRWLGISAFVAVAVIGCVQWREFASSPAPDVTADWRALLDDLRAFERTIGYEPTNNFKSVTAERESYPFCGQASRYTLPYSYEDPAIRWFDDVSEEQCHTGSSEIDVYFGSVEAMGEIGTPVTPSMISGTLDRFVYLVIHEDCHDQFDLPYGVEEALCDVVTYHAMASFSKQKFRWYSREDRAIMSYAREQSKQTRATIRHYAQLDALYARYRRAELSAPALLRERAVVFTAAERELEQDEGTLNNVVLANLMTYSRHYPFLESVFVALGSDLARAVNLFRHVDKRKPSRAETLQRHRIADENSVEFVRAYETALVETTAKALGELKAATR